MKSYRPFPGVKLNRKIYLKCVELRKEMVQVCLKCVLNVCRAIRGEDPTAARSKYVEELRIDMSQVCVCAYVYVWAYLCVGLCA